MARPGPSFFARPSPRRLAARATGRPTSLASTEGQISPDLDGHRQPRPLAEVYASFDAGIAAGELELTGDVVRRLTGEEPEALLEFLVAIAPLGLVEPQASPRR